MRDAQDPGRSPADEEREGHQPTRLDRAGADEQHTMAFGQGGSTQVMPAHMAANYRAPQPSSPTPQGGPQFPPSGTPAPQYSSWEPVNQSVPQGNSPFPQMVSEHAYPPAPAGLADVKSGKTATTAAPSSTLSNAAKAIALVSGLLGLLAPFPAWVTFVKDAENISINGVGSSAAASSAQLGSVSIKDGHFVLVLALALLVVGGLALARKLQQRIAGIAALVIGVLLLIVFGLEIYGMSQAASGYADGYQVSVGFGVWLVLLSALTGIISGILLLVGAGKDAKAAAVNSSKPSATALHASNTAQAPVQAPWQQHP